MIEKKTEKIFRQNFESSLSKCPVDFERIATKIDFSQYKRPIAPKKKWLKPFVITFSCVFTAILVTTVLLASPLFRASQTAFSSNAGTAATVLTEGASSFASDGGSDGTAISEFSSGQ